jgi:hypothetical protein
LAVRWQDCTPIFGSGGGDKLAQEFGIPFLGNVPIYPELGNCAESGKNFTEAFPETPVTEAVKKIVQGIRNQVEQD